MRSGRAGERLIGTKRERLLDWMRNGDPKDVPVMMGFYTFELAAALLGKEEREVSWAEAIEAAHRTGTHLIALLGSPLPFHALPFMDDIRLTETRESLPDGTCRRTKTIRTPEGDMVEISETPPGSSSFTRKFLVNGLEDLPALACFIRRTTEEIVKNPLVRAAVKEELLRVKEKAGNAFPTMLWVFVSATELMSSYYMGQETAVFCAYDEPALMEELMECHWQMTRVWLSLGAELDIDIFGYAVNGFEWLNPDLYARYMVPQARRINDFARSRGRLSWIHTCGKMRKIAELGMYRDMEVDVVESLSLPPTGDIEDLAKTRALIGTDKVTRGGVNCELFYGSDREALRTRTEHVLDSVRGFKHMIGDTNPSYPTYPWENMREVIDTVRRRGVLFE